MKSLKRTVHAIPVLLVIWLLQLALAALAGTQVRTLVGAAMQGAGWLDDGHLLGALLELVSQNPSVAAGLAVSVVSSTLLGFALWIPAAGGVFERLAGHALGPSEVLAGARWSLPVAAQTLWTWIARGIVLAILGFAASKAPWIGLLLPLVYVCFVLGFDYSRARILLQDEKPYSPTSMLRGLRDTIKEPTLLLGGALLVIAQLSSAHLPLWIAMHAEQGTSTLILVRATAFIPLFFASWRIAAVISRVEDRYT
jgi:hypothetical protein